MSYALDIPNTHPDRLISGSFQRRYMSRLQQLFWFLNFTRTSDFQRVIVANLLLYLQCELHTFIAPLRYSSPD